METICSECSAPIAATATCACGGLPAFTEAAPRIDRPASSARSGPTRIRRCALPEWRVAIGRVLPAIPPTPSSRSARATCQSTRRTRRGVRGSGPAFVSPSRHEPDRVVQGSRHDGRGLGREGGRRRGRRLRVDRQHGGFDGGLRRACRYGCLRAQPSGKISNAKLAQMRDYGAKVVPVEGRSTTPSSGSRASPMATSRSSTRPIVPHRRPEVRGLHLARTPRLAGPGLAQLPGGNLGNASAFGKGFREALASG